MATEARECIGIDLGTSNSAAAKCDGISEKVTIAEITQIVATDAIANRVLLPSVLFCAPPNENAPTSLPWTASELPSWIVGQSARERGVLLPGRCVASAKSWLGHRMIDRRAAVLPLNAEEDITKISPYRTTVKILEHLRFSIDHSGNSSCPLVLTVPASFEESARALTYEAAIDAGFSSVTLLEEPLAALYAWLQQHSEDWRDHLKPGDVILVCDVGGGTSDFSLITLLDVDGTLTFRRISVGEHILLGGDNMDLALAHHLRQRLLDGGGELDSWQFSTLVQSARIAKESILSETGNDSHRVSVPTRGGSLFSSAITVEIFREDVAQIILEGFFPLVSADDLPRERKQSALREFGLPYAYDPAITRHLARFLSASKRNVEQDAELQSLMKNGRLTPNKVLFNGGVFAGAVFKERVTEQLTAWAQDQNVQVLENPELDCAVARGAAYYGGVVSNGGGLKIRAGLSRSYYIGVEPMELAVPGIPLKIKGICIAPQGLEEGTSTLLADREFMLATGEQVEFRLFSSTERSADVVGIEISDAERELIEGAPIQGTVMSSDSTVPVVLGSRFTEVGTLEITMNQKGGADRWRFEFDVRGETGN